MTNFFACSCAFCALSAGVPGAKAIFMWPVQVPTGFGAAKDDEQRAAKNTERDACEIDMLRLFIPSRALIKKLNLCQAGLKG
jgi:hypothetical protein